MVGERRWRSLISSITKLVIEAHGGVIGVASVVGKGSTFWFELTGTQSERAGNTAHISLARSILFEQKHPTRK